MADNYITRTDEKGSIHIAEDVIATIITAAVAEVDGVAGLTNTAGGEIADLLRIKSAAKGVKVRFDDETVSVDVLAMVRFGCNITAVARKIQEAAAAAVDSMTGLPCTVNVHISGVAFDKAAN